MRLSVLILTHERPDWAHACVDSLERGGVPPGVEVLVGFNGPEAGWRETAQSLTERRPWASAVLLEPMNRGAARNRLAGLARGELLYFLDDDTTAPPDFLERALAAFERNPNAPVVAGPNVGPPGASPFERAVDHFLGSRLGAGPMRVRFKAVGPERRLPGWCFTLCSLGVRREVFTRHGFAFPDRCKSAEENLFLHRVERALGSPVYAPDLSVYHRRRATAAGFARQLFGYGQGRMQITRRDSTTLQAWVFGPPALALLAAAAPLAPRTAGAAGLLWAAACAFETATLALRDPSAALRLPAATLTAYAAYAFGLAAGAFLPLPGEEPRVKAAGALVEGGQQGGGVLAGIGSQFDPTKLG